MRSPSSASMPAPTSASSASASAGVGAARAQVNLDVAGRGENGGHGIRVRLVDRRDQLVQVRFRPCPRRDRIGCAAPAAEPCVPGAAGIRVRTSAPVPRAVRAAAPPRGHPVSIHCPGAVPLGFGRASAPSMTKAWRRLISAIWRPMRANRAWMDRRSPGGSSVRGRARRPRRRGSRHPRWAPSRR